MDERILLQYLSDHPDFLVRHQDSLRAKGITIPDVTSPPNVIDVTSKIADKARKEARKAAKTNHKLLTVAAENMLHWQELHLATLGFLACNELTGFAQMVHEELPLIFGLESAHLIMPSQDALPEAESLGFLTLSETDIAALIGTDVISMGKPSQRALSLISTTPESLALMRLPDQLPAPVAGSLLMLGGRDEDSFTQQKGRALLLHLSEMVGVCLLSLIQAPHHHD